MTELMVYGWASVATEHGVPVIDNGGDVIAPREMELAVTKYMEGPALARVMHVTSRRPAGVVLHSFPLTDEIKKALGIQCNREGWIVGVCVSDPEVASAVETGELSAFSIGGVGWRELL